MRLGEDGRGWVKLGDASEVWRGWERLGKVKRIREDGQGWVEGREVR